MFPDNIEEVVLEYGKMLRLDQEYEVARLRDLLAECESPAEQLFLARFTSMLTNPRTHLSPVREDWEGKSPYDLQEGQGPSYGHPHVRWDWEPHQMEFEGTDRLQFDLFVRVPVAFEADDYPTREVSYRLDFLARVQPDREKWPHASDDYRAVRPALLAVEVDGHDYHERTKEQASRDRRRDRDLQSIGVPTMRFTASEVYHDEDSSLCYQAWRAVWKRAVELGLHRLTERKLP